MEVQESNSQVIAYHKGVRWNRRTEEGKKNDFTLLLFPSPKVTQLSAKKDLLSPCSSPQQKIRPLECQATPAVWEAAKKNHFLLVPSIILRSAQHLGIREWLGFSESIKGMQILLTAFQISSDSPLKSIGDVFHVDSPK